MPNGPNWFSWFSFPFFAPLSGSVSQDISPSLYRGVPEIEADVISEAGSFGRQLGIISDAVLELAAKLDERPRREPLLQKVGEGEVRNDGALGQLRARVDHVEAIKTRHREAAQKEADRSLARLKRVDPAAYERFTARLAIDRETPDSATD